jgi:hypothetical protein
LVFLSLSFSQLERPSWLDNPKGLNFEKLLSAFFLKFSILNFQRRPWDFPIKTFENSIAQLLAALSCSNFSDSDASSSIFFKAIVTCFCLLSCWPWISLRTTTFSSQEDE